MKEKLLGSLESRIMNFFWQKSDPVTISDLHKHLIKHDKIAYTTVSTVVGRLVTKKLLQRMEVKGVFYYSCRGTKHDFLARTSRNLIRSLLGNFGDVAIVGFVEELKGNPKALKTLKELADEIE